MRRIQSHCQKIKDKHLSRTLPRLTSDFGCRQQLNQENEHEEKGNSATSETGKDTGIDDLMRKIL